MGQGEGYDQIWDKIKTPLRNKSHATKFSRMFESLVQRYLPINIKKKLLICKQNQICLLQTTISRIVPRIYQLNTNARCRVSLHYLLFSKLHTTRLHIEKSSIANPYNIICQKTLK